jgi:hypothetical protein
MASIFVSGVIAGTDIPTLFGAIGQNPKTLKDVLPLTVQLL